MKKYFLNLLLGISAPFYAMDNSSANPSKQPDTVLAPNKCPWNLSTSTSQTSKTTLTANAEGQAYTYDPEAHSRALEAHINLTKSTSQRPYSE